jgi:hypothetical protein
MELTQIILLIGVAFIVSASITSYLHNRKQNKLPYSEAITNDVLDQIVDQIEKSTNEIPAKPKKKRKYYPKKPKTNI